MHASWTQRIWIFNTQQCTFSHQNIYLIYLPINGAELIKVILTQTKANNAFRRKKNTFTHIPVCFFAYLSASERSVAARRKHSPQIGCSFRFICHTVCLCDSRWPKINVVFSSVQVILSLDKVYEDCGRVGASHHVLAHLFYLLVDKYIDKYKPIYVLVVQKPMYRLAKTLVAKEAFA